MIRAPEPELMDDDAQARAYALADFEEPHAMFVSLLRERFPGLDGGIRALDLGCGAADIAIRIARAFPHSIVDAVDGAQAMLRYGHQAVAAAGLEGRVSLLHGYLPGLRLPAAEYDVVFSNSLLHHLKNPLDLWRTVRQSARRDARVFVMDLLRPPSRAHAAALVDEYAADEPEILRRDFFNSLCAAYRPDEVQRQLADCGLAHLSVERASDRHLVVSGTLS